MQDESLFRRSSLCVVGNVNRDVKTAPFRGGESLLCDGETSVGAIIETIGGGGANGACAAAALGARVGFLGKVGSDGLGDRLEETLVRWGVTPRLVRDPECPTGTSIALAYEDGHRHFLSCLPNNARLRLEDLDLGFLCGFDHLYRADVWFSEPMLLGGNGALFAAAREAGLTVSLDINWDPLWGRATAERVEERKRAIRTVLPLVDLVHGNERELREFAGCASIDAALGRITDWGARAIVLHRGAAGAGWYERGNLVTEGPSEIRGSVEATGTGDVLSVCMMLLHRFSEIPVREKLRLSNRIVAEFIQGDRVLIPRLS